MKYYHSGKVMKKFREELNLTQADVGKKIKCHSQMISNIERGVCFYPKKTMPKIISIFKIKKDLKKLMELSLALRKDYEIECDRTHKEIFNEF